MISFFYRPSTLCHVLGILLLFYGLPLLSPRFSSLVHGFPPLVHGFPSLAQGFPSLVHSFPPLALGFPSLVECPRISLT